MSTKLISNLPPSSSPSPSPSTAPQLQSPPPPLSHSLHGHVTIQTHRPPDFDTIHVHPLPLSSPLQQLSSRPPPTSVFSTPLLVGKSRPRTTNAFSSPEVAFPSGSTSISNRKRSRSVTKTQSSPTASIHPNRLRAVRSVSAMTTPSASGNGGRGRSSVICMGITSSLSEKRGNVGKVSVLDMLLRAGRGGKRRSVSVSGITPPQLQSVGLESTGPVPENEGLSTQSTPTEQGTHIQSSPRPSAASLTNTPHVSTPTTSSTASPPAKKHAPLGHPKEVTGNTNTNVLHLVRQRLLEAHIVWTNEVIRLYEEWGGNKWGQGLRIESDYDSGNVGRELGWRREPVGRGGEVRTPSPRGKRRLARVDWEDRMHDRVFRAHERDRSISQTD